MLWLDQKYARMIPLEGFVEKRQAKAFANFRCMVCGDSKRKRSLKRGWFVAKGDGLFYYCHNCNASMSLRKFLQTYFPYLYEDYRRELMEYKVGSMFHAQPPSRPVKDNNDDLFASTSKDLDLQQIKELPLNHKAVQYINNRKLPYEKFKEYYYSDNFYNWCKEKQPDNFQHEYKYDPRIIIPFRDVDGTIFALNGRTISDITPKYLTLKFDESKPKVFGLDTVDKDKIILATEGPIDAHFLPNSIACGGALGSLHDIINYMGIKANSQIVVVTDNEPRNPQTCNFIKKLIDEGFRVVIWPDNQKEKDINDLVMSGLRYREILELIAANTYYGLKAKLQLNAWKKCVRENKRGT